MRKPYPIVAIVVFASAVFSASAAYSQAYPSKTIRIFTTAIGAGGDFVSRLIAQGISGPLGQSVIVENRPSGIVLGQAVVQAPPDGYTLLLSGAALWRSQLLQSIPYDVEKDFVPISITDRSPHLIVVHPGLPINNIKELVAYAKAKPGALNYASGGSGSSSHLAAELFKSMAGVDIVRIPYKSGAVETTDLLAGQVQLTFSTGSAAPHVRSGKLRALAVTSAQPSTLYPGVPTVTASGVPGYQAESLGGLFAPAKTPDAIIRRLNQEVARVLSTAEAKERILSIGAEAVGSSPEELATAVRTEMVVWGKLIKDLGIKPD